jgi:hypothetical protein
VSATSPPAGGAPTAPDRPARADAPAADPAAAVPSHPPPAAAASVETAEPVEARETVDFVCEDDVRQAVEAGRRIPVNDRTIITPSARDLAGRHRIFVQS